MNWWPPYSEQAHPQWCTGCCAYRGIEAALVEVQVDHESASQIANPIEETLVRETVPTDLEAVRCETAKALSAGKFPDIGIRHRDKADLRDRERTGNSGRVIKNFALAGFI